MEAHTIWILNHYAQEPGGPGGTRHYSLAKHLKEHEWDAWIIAASVELNTNRQRLFPTEKQRLQYFDGVPFLWLKTPPYRGNGLDRVRNMFAYTVRCLLPGTTELLPRPAIVIGSSVHPLAAIAGCFLARRFDCAFVFEVRDLWPQTLIDLGRITAHGIFARLLRAVETWLYRRADLIIVLLPYADKYIQPLGISSDKILYLPNGCDLTDFPVYPAQPSPVFNLMYFGAHGTANGLDNVIDAMQIIARKAPGKQIRLRLIGDGPLKRNLLERVMSSGTSNIVFEDPVGKSEIPQLAASADAFVFNLVDAPVFRFGISSNKLFDFMAASRPIIFCCAAGNNPIRDSQSGITVRPGDPDALADAILCLAEMSPEARARMGHNARVYVETNHAYESLAGRLAACLTRLTKQPSE
jgi:glycosyltransferase involved in cell wall biosynthesis